MKWRQVWEADRRGKICALCGKELPAEEIIYRFRVSVPQGGGFYGKYEQQAPVCAACRPDYGEWSTPTPCAGCGRLMAYRLGTVGKVPIACSRKCSLEATERKLGRQKDRQQTCVVCQTKFTPERADALTCSHRCRQKAYRERARDSKRMVTMSPPSNRHDDVGRDT
jgi:hypothetical protein